MLSHLVRYTNYYQFGKTFEPSLTEEGSAEKWFYFRIIHRMRVRWESEQQDKRQRDTERNSSRGQSQSSRGRERPKREVRPEAAAEEGRPMTHAEKVKEAQDRFGIQPHEKPETLNQKPKGFKSTRLKKRRR